jgi:hypothetical protein
MFVSMTPPKKWRAVLAVLVLGLWAGGASAQSDDDSGWFDERVPNERPQLQIHGQGQYDPPPPDFRGEPPAAASDRGPGPGDGSVTESDTTYDDDERESPDSQQRAVGEFGPHLAPYGYWVDDPYYGRVWVPNRGVVGSDFRPYVTGGRWELTGNDDWLWASDYPFGWVTFHYGRWAWLSGSVGWGWVPGYTYSPAWVDFRVGSAGYVGWGPLPPYSVWRGGVFVSLGGRRSVPYIFCPTTYVFSTGLPRYVVRDRYRARSIAAQTYRYQPRYVAGSRVRSPSPRDARIPDRYVPTRRVIAQPRGTYVASAYRGRDTLRGASSPSESRYRTSPRYTRDPGRREPGPSQRSPQGSRSAPSGTYRERQVSPSRETPRATSRETRSRGDGGGERRQAPRARDDGGRERGGSRAQPSERRTAPAASGGERRGSGGAPRASGGSRGGSSGNRSSGTQQRSRSRDDHR